MENMNSIQQLVDSIHEADTDNTLTEKDNYIFELIKEYVGKNGATGKQEQRKLLLDVIGRDHNLVNSTVINKLIHEGIISDDDLWGIGIKQVFIDTLGQNLKSEKYPLPSKALDKVENPSTEVYFWGIPASGKTCAIGALLSVAVKRDLPMLNCYEAGKCQSQAYQEKLTEMFPYDRNGSTKVMPLPSGTSIDNTYEMFFELTDKKNNVLPITFIDMAGELIRCMYKKNKGLSLNKQEEKALQTVTNVLKDNRTDNRKIHIFVLEYGGENRKYENISQTNYLSGAISYLKEIECEDGEKFNVFKDVTDAIYLMVTQVDKSGQKDENLKEHIRHYIESESNYINIADQLKKICEDNHINRDKLAVILFSLGEVCFKDYCMFSPRFTRNALEILLSHIYNYKKWQKKTWYQKLLS